MGRAPTRKKGPGLRTTLRRTFGHSELRPGQQEVIERALAGRDTLAIMPTGAGKSLCYQLPALLLEGTTVVVSPLIALMKDQADRLVERGVEAEAVNSTLSASEEAAAIEEIEANRAEFVFTTPERLADPQFVETLRRTPIDLLVIDEAHCISRWGHDFRPAYLELGHAAAELGNPAILALTATATPAVVEDIRHALGRPRMQVVDVGLYRPNLVYAVRQVTNEREKRATLLELLRAHPGPAIVYAATVKVAEAVHDFLRAEGEDALLYHGRLAAHERAGRQDAFMEGRARIMVATNAFGMGIDKADIRAVIHYQVPGSIEAYYQESGRAGRDGADAWCTLIYDHEDRRVQQYFLAGHTPEADELRAVHDGTVDELAKGRVQRVRAILEEAGLLRRERVPHSRYVDLANRCRKLREADHEKLERITFYAHGAHCRWKMILEYFGEGAELEACGRCDNCRHPVRAREPAPPAHEAHRTGHAALQPGEAVEVPRYGRGIVESASAERVVVSFPDGATRQFVPAYVSRAGAGERPA